MRVIQGSFESEPRGADAYSVEGEQTQAQKKLALSFSLKQQESESKDGEGRDVYDYEAELTLKPEATGRRRCGFPRDAGCAQRPICQQGAQGRPPPI